MSLFSLIDNVSPIELDLNTEISAAPGSFTDILGWLSLNRLPLMMWICIFFACCGISGFTINFVTLSGVGFFMPVYASVPMALIIGLFLPGRLGKIVATLIPNNESSAISTETFSGRLVTITLGTATKGSPAEASFTDDFEQKHYVMVEPIDNGDIFSQGDSVILVERCDKAWLAMKPTDTL